MRVSECIERLIEMEYDAAELFGRISGTARNSIAASASIFKKEEEGHVETLRKIRESITEEELAVTAQDLESKDFIKTSERYEAMNFETMDQRDFFTFALQGEKDSMMLYERLMDAYGEYPRVAEVFSRLIDEERKHMYFLLKILHEMK